MNISIETKILSAEENEIIVSMIKKAYGEYDLDFSTLPNTTSFLAKDNDKIIGHAAVVKEKHQAELRGFFVDPTYRQKGIGTLLDATRAQHILNEASIELVHGDVAAFNTASQQIKESIGFRAVGVYLGSAPQGDKQRASQIPSFWDVRETLNKLCQQLWIPTQYHSISTRILEQFGITYLSINDNDEKLTGKTQFTKTTSFGATKASLTTGENLEETISELNGEQYWLGLTLDATKKTTPESIRRLNKLGFFFAGLTPTGTITLQKLTNQKIDTKKIPIIETYRPIFNFVAEEYKKSL